MIRVFTGIFSLFFLLSLPVTAQSSTERPPLALRLTLMDESISFPDLSTFRYPLNPALSLGAEYTLNNRPKHAWILGGELGYYYHRHLRATAFLNLGLAYRRQLGRASLTGRLGLGYGLAFATAPVFTAQDGEFSEAPNSGSLVFMPTTSLKIGYRLSAAPRAPELFLNYQFAVEQPLAVLPFPHLLAGIGLRFTPFK
ncbi:hypothetical protein [Lewinella sp. W8]|uniref:hypothetical protein n=1 Tax=Lewinella sp. W8 TaxID=2528208 RepID=UPI001067C405|nr:hypothetical protein [Lewinella sp. W8]MTB50793.1 hypothetical protein [Lewinella sp. W8]